jgi:hypothetical protein
MTSNLDLVQEAIAALKNSLRVVNQPANMDGLLACHFCSHFVPDDGWIVFEQPKKWVDESESSPDQAPYMSVLGCLIAHQVGTNGTFDEAIQQFSDSLDRLRQRKNIFQSPTSWIFQPATVLGISMGIRASKSESLKQWMVSQLTEGIQFHHATLYQKLIYLYAANLLDAILNFEIPKNFKDYSLYELSLVIWLIKRGVVVNDKKEWLEEASSQVLLLLLTEGIPDENEDFRHAILLDVVLDYVYSRSHLPSEEFLLRVLRGFEPAMERWQYKWIITDEYHIQAILWLMLRPYFEDIRYEENLPKVGRSGHRYDLGIPSLGKLVEVKYIRKKEDFQKIVHEVGIDAVQIKSQAQFREIIVFAFDETCAVENYAWTRKALLELDTVKEVVIVSAPSTTRNPSP